MIETRIYSDGTTATGSIPLPSRSPAQQNSETGACDKCQGSGKLFDQRIGDVACDECEGHGWFNNGVAGASMEEIRANLKEAIARGRDPFLSPGQCAALVRLIDAGNSPATYVYPSKEQGPCAVCRVPWTKHPSYPTCCDHAYVAGVNSPDGEQR